LRGFVVCICIHAFIRERENHEADILPALLDKAAAILAALSDKAKTP
jgi:hypothetical protein